MRLAVPWLWLRELLATLWSRPDELMLQLGAGGERLVARMRALLAASLLLVPPINALLGATANQTMAGLGAAVLLNVVALLWLGLARRSRHHAWLPYATGTWDVSVITAALAVLGTADPVAATNHLVIWSFYPVTIALTALRNDGRLTLYVGLLSIVQYALLVLLVFVLASPERLSSIDYGTAAAWPQLQRLGMLALMTLLTAVIVYRIQRLVELSGSDGLTGLPNRSWLTQRMPQVLDSLRQRGSSLTLALIDLDNFRRINEEAGHVNGDRAIRQTAAALNEMLHEDERLVRIGGQEFVVLMHCPIGSAWERLDRLRRSMGDRPFLPGLGGDAQVITFSGGLAAYPQDGGDVSGLLGSADRRLQAAKRDGRNRVVARDA